MVLLVGTRQNPLRVLPNFLSFFWNFGPIWKLSEIYRTFSEGFGKRLFFFRVHNDAFQRVHLGAIVLMTSVSIPLIWQGDEFGEARPLGSNNPHRKKFPMQWSLLEKE